MKLKCKVCGKKGMWDHNKVSEYYSSQLLMISSFIENKNVFICRKCIARILDNLASESRMIDRLYEPEIKEMKK